MPCIIHVYMYIIMYTCIYIQLLASMCLSLCMHAHVSFAFPLVSSTAIMVNQQWPLEGCFYPQIIFDILCHIEYNNYIFKQIINLQNMHFGL